MLEAVDIYGTVYEGGSAVLMARVVAIDNDPVLPTDFSSVTYSINERNACQTGLLNPVAGHQALPLDASEVLYSLLQTGSEWTVDSTGYNFRHEIDIGSVDAFPKANRDYQVKYRLIPFAGQPVILRFLLRAI